MSSPTTSATTPAANAMPATTTTEAKPEGDYVRPLAADDVSVVKLLLGAGIMEGLAGANSLVMRNPFTIALILGLGVALNHVLGFKAHPAYKITYLAPLIGPALLSLPVLAGVEYVQRWPFQARLRQVVGSVDVVDLGSYYSAPSAAWVFEHNGEVRGFVALDAARAGSKVPSLLGAEDGEIAPAGSVDINQAIPAKSASSTKSTAKSSASAAPAVAEIRHLTVDAPLRSFGIGTELLAAALDAAFAPASPVQKVIVLTSPYTPGGERVFAKCGFAAVVPEDGWRAPEPLGLLKARGRWMAVGRAEWEKKRAEVFAAAGGK